MKVRAVLVSWQQ